MRMSLSGKVALVTGGASGIGKGCVEEFLKNDVKGVVIADVNVDLGKGVEKEFNEKFGQGKVIFIKTDVSNTESFDNAFQLAVKSYSNIDILINSAAIFDEINWERLLNINFIGTSRGCDLAINKYFPKYKSASEAFVINIASIMSLIPLAYAPHYTSSKHAIIGLTRAFGGNKTIAKQGIYVMAVCPGATDTPMHQETTHVNVIYPELVAEERATMVSQTVEVVAKSVVEVLNKPENGSLWLINESKLFKITYPSLEQMINA